MTIELTSTTDSISEKLLQHKYVDTVARSHPFPVIDILKDSTDKSETEGDMKEYKSMFIDRYNRMKQIMSSHNFKGSKLQFRYFSEKENYGKNVTGIGLIREVRATKNDNRLIILEDPTGSFPFILTDENLYDTADKLLPDQMVALEGTISDDGEICFVNDIYNPDVPRSFSPNKADRPVSAVFISDIHVGSNKFAYEKWLDFVDWVRETPEISYIVHAGDLVEGIGIFPNQKQELSVINLEEQYELCGYLFSHLPDDIEIISCTGNHDSIRVAEPQPAIPKKYLKYFPENFTCVSNPSTVVLDDNVIVELYHGASIHDFTEFIPEADEDNPEVPMKYMLEKRHLAPTFGNNSRLVPEIQDYHVLEQIPDVLHTGHVHTYGVGKYRNVSLLNTGGWVYQTSYQERMNIQPTVGRVTYMNLQTGKTSDKQF